MKKFVFVLMASAILTSCCNCPKEAVVEAEETVVEEVVTDSVPTDTTVVKD